MLKTCFRMMFAVLDAKATGFVIINGFFVVYFRTYKQSHSDVLKNLNYQLSIINYQLKNKVFFYLCSEIPMQSANDAVKPYLYR